MEIVDGVGSLAGVRVLASVAAWIEMGTQTQACEPNQPYLFRIFEIFGQSVNNCM